MISTSFHVVRSIAAVFRRTADRLKAGLPTGLLHGVRSPGFSRSECITALASPVSQSFLADSPTRSGQAGMPDLLFPPHRAHAGGDVEQMPPTRLASCSPSRAIRTLCRLAALTLTAVLAATPRADPDWWTGVFGDGSSPAGDNAPVNQGQLKWVATNAYVHLQTNLTGGAGFTLTLTATNNYYPVNQGQLKDMAKSFYDRLIAVGYTNAYPWTTTTADDAGSAMANVGQVKNVFNFDLGKGVCQESDMILEFKRPVSSGCDSCACSSTGRAVRL